LATAFSTLTGQSAMMIEDPRTFLRTLFDAAVAAADPARVIEGHLPPRPKGRTIVVGAGKASAAMAAAFEGAWAAAGNGPIEGLVVTRYGHGARTSRIEVVEAAHPVPDAAGQAVARRMLELVSGLTSNDLVVALISGGGSALLSLPAEGISAADKQAVNRALLGGGVPIREMNCVRKHLSRVKGGRLAAAAHPARVVTLVISDIPGDEPALVASGPTIPDATTREDALAIVERHGLDLPASAMAWLHDERCAAPRPGDPVFAGNEVHLIATAQMSLEAAARLARERGVAAAILSDAIEGEAREAGGFHAAIARQVLLRGEPFTPPLVLLSGGETTVTVRHKGRGGRNSEFLLALALAIAGEERVFALAADTDGIDGSEANAGAYADGTSASRMRAAGVDPRAALDRNDAYAAFEAAGDLLVTGPTATNVNDFRAIYIAGQPDAV
jgi:glycerate 2-kinase